MAEPRGKESLAAQYREPVTTGASLGDGRTVSVTSGPGTHGTVDLTVDVTAGRKPTAITGHAMQPAPRSDRSR